MKILICTLLITFVCSGAFGATKIKNLKCFTPEYFTTSFGLHINKNGKFTSWLAHVDVRREGDSFSYTTTMRYGLDQCFFSN